MPNIPQINIEGTIYKLKDAELRENIVLAQNTQPTNENNRIWLQENSEDRQVPTWEEFSEVKSALEQSNTEIDTIEEEIYNFVDIASSDVKSKATGAIETETIGQTITFGTQSNILHYYLEVTTGEIYKIQIRKAANTLYNIVFTDSNGVVKKLYGQGNGTMHVDVETIAVPENVARLYISAQESSGPADWNVNDRVRKTTVDVAKLSDISVINGQISTINKNIGVLDDADDLIISNNSEPPVYLIAAEDIEIGGIVNGENNATQNRARSIHMIPVFKGDILLSKVATNQDYTFYVIYYNSQKAWSSDSVANLMNNVRPVVIASDGYIRILFNPSNTEHTETEMKSYFGSLISIYRARGSDASRAILENKLNANCFEYVIGASNIAIGKLNFNDGSLSGDAAYGFTPFLIPVNVGDALYRKYSDIGFGVAYYDNNYAFVGSTGNTYKYITNPTYIPNGVAFIRVGFQLANSTTPAISDFDGIISIIRFENRDEKLTLGILNRVEHSKYDDCVHGYINSNNGAISNHNYYMATVKYFRVKPGDIVRCANEDLNIWVMEYDLNLNPVRYSDGYIRSLSRNPYPAGEWHVGTDGYVRAHFTNFQAQTEVDISTYYNSLEIVHSLSALNEYDAYAQKSVAPTNWVKARKIREGSDLYTQSCTIIKGYLYCAIDDYNDYTVIQKVDMETGEIIKTYTQDFGHTSIDYCEETDALLLTYGSSTLAIYPNFSAALEGDSLTINDCIQIDCGDVLSGATVCFGEDEYTVYAFIGHDTSAVRHDKCYKLQLGYGETDLSGDGYGTYVESNSYNGTAKLLKTFNGIVREFHDGQYGGRSLSYAQDMKYDGYLYLCFGTYGYNCYVIDLDELSDTYKIVGNYKIKYRASDYSDLYGEAEGLAINGSKIVTTLRDTVGGVSCMFEFNRN